MVVDKEKRDKLINLIQNLLALGDKSRNNSEAEAETAMLKAQELLNKYNLSMSEVLIHESEEDRQRDLEVERVVVFEMSNMGKWQKSLISIVALATETKGYFSPRNFNNKFGVGFIGTKWDVAIAGELYKYLYYSASKMARKFYSNSCSSQTSFLHGFCFRLHERVELEAERFKQNQTETENSNYAIVLFSKEKAIADLAKEMGLRPGRTRESSFNFNREAYNNGQSEANKVDLRTNNKLGGECNERRCLNG